MIPLRISRNLPFTAVTITHAGSSLTLDRVLVDTGSAACVFSTERLASIGVVPNPTDRIQTMRGVGGHEYVIEKHIDHIAVGSLVWTNATIQMGAVDYGIPMDGILGLDFLLAVGATLDFKSLVIR